MPSNQLDMKTLKHLACWGSALKSMANELSSPSTFGAAFREMEPLKIVGLVLQMNEDGYNTMPPEQLRAHLLDLAQKLNVTPIEDTTNADH